MLKIITKHTRGLALFCLLTAPLSMLIEVFCDLQQPTLMSDIIDNGIAADNLQYVLIHGGKMLGFALLGLLGGAGCTILANYASLQMGAALRAHLFNISVSLSAKETNRLQISSLITRITNDVTQMQTMVMTITRSMVRAPLLLLGGIVMSAIVCPDLAWILAVVIPILLFLIIGIIIYSIPLFTIVQQKIDGINRVMRENLLGIRTIKSYTLEERQYQEFAQVNQELKQDSLKAQYSTITLSPAVTLLLNLSIVFALWLGGNLQLNHLIENGQIIAFVNYLIQITNAMLNTINTITTLSRSKSSSDRIADILQAEKTLLIKKSSRPISTGAIRFEQVDFSYNEMEPAVRNLDFTIPNGSKLGIIGSTGSGKSTLIQLLAGIYRPTCGEIYLNNVPYSQLPLEELHTKIAVAPQEALLFSGTIFKNLAYGKPQTTLEAVTNAAQTAQASAFIEKLPTGYQAPVEQRGKNFSGGQRQRLNIARALVLETDILILDDSTSAVDLKTESLIREQLKKVRQHKTTIMISQRISSLIDSDLILVMDKGEIIAKGTHAELLQTSDFYRELAAQQLEMEVDNHAAHA